MQITLPPRSTYSELERAFLADRDEAHALWLADRRDFRRFALWGGVAAVVGLTLVFCLDMFVAPLENLAFLLYGGLGVAALLAVLRFVRYALRNPPADGERWQAYFVANGWSPKTIFPDPPPETMAEFKAKGLTALETLHYLLAMIEKHGLSGRDVIVQWQPAASDMRLSHQPPVVRKSR